MSASFQAGRNNAGGNDERLNCLRSMAAERGKTPAACRLCPPWGARTLNVVLLDRERHAVMGDYKMGGG